MCAHTCVGRCIRVIWGDIDVCLWSTCVLTHQHTWCGCLYQGIATTACRWEPSNSDSLHKRGLPPNVRGGWGAPEPAHGGWGAGGHLHCSQGRQGQPQVRWRGRLLRFMDPCSWRGGHQWCGVEGCGVGALQMHWVLCGDAVPHGCIPWGALHMGLSKTRGDT